VEACARIRSLGETALLQTLTSTLKLLAKRWLMLAAELKELDGTLDRLTSRPAKRLREQGAHGDRRGSGGQHAPTRRRRHGGTGAGTAAAVSRASVRRCPDFGERRVLLQLRLDMVHGGLRQQRCGLYADAAASRLLGF
jgi:hypothetical protein